MSDLIRRKDLVKELNAQFAVGDITREIANDILNHLPSAEPERNWTPVTEALPKNYEQTICIDSRGAMMIGMYGEYGWTFPCYMTEPVAWMPLPEPWRGE